MKQGYMRVLPDPTGTAVGKIRKIRCTCTGDGLIITSKLWDPDTPWKEKKVNYFTDAKNDIITCPNCGTSIWYTS